MIDILQFIKAQQIERYRAFVIHGPAMSYKTKFARKLAQKVAGKYIDLLPTALNEPWGQMIDEFGAVDFQRWLLQRTQSEQIVLVDNLDFLFNTWPDHEKIRFLTFIDKLSNTLTPCVHGFVLQDDPSLQAGAIAANTKGMSRVISIQLIQDLQEG